MGLCVVNAEQSPCQDVTAAMVRVLPGHCDIAPRATPSNDKGALGCQYEVSGWDMAVLRKKLCNREDRKDSI